MDTLLHERQANHTEARRRVEKREGRQTGRRHSKQLPLKNERGEMNKFYGWEEKLELQKVQKELDFGVH